MYEIYLIYNTLNGKIYVGKSQNSEQRFKSHLRIANGGKSIYPESFSYIHAALNKYGYNNFILKIVEQNIKNEEAAFSKEKEWISQFKMYGYQLYNLTIGGDGASGHKMSDLGKLKLSIFRKSTTPWNKGKVTPKEVREKQSISALRRFKTSKHPMSGRKSSLKNKPRSQEFCDKISKSKKGIPKSHEHMLKTSKLNDEQVSQIKSLIISGMKNKDIAKMFNVHRDTISRIKNNKTWRS